MATQRFYDGQPGPDIRRELNNLEAVFDDAIANARGPQGWAPVVAVVTDGTRRVLRITDWTGGGGSKPAVTGFIGATGIVATAELAVDIRGSIGATGPSNALAIGTVTSAASPSASITGASPNQTLNLVLPKGDKGDTGNTGPANTLTIGTVSTGAASATITGTAPSQVLNLVIPQGIQGLQGPQGPKGDTGLQGPQGPKGDTGPQGVQGLAGLHGWTPKFAVVTDGARRVQQVVDWFGGTGSKPATGEYVGATGLVATIAQAVDIRGPSGAGTGNVNPTGVIAANDLAAFADSTGEVIKALKADDLPVSTATSAALDTKVDKVVGKDLSTEDYTTADKTKLNGIATSATANSTDAQLRDRATHTGTQAISTVSGLQTALDAKQPIDADLTAIAALTDTSGLLKKTAANTWSLDTATYLTEAPSDGKTYGRKDAAWVEVVSGGGASITNVAYADRVNLRSQSPVNGEMAVIDGLGLFVFATGSDEPDDDESCFATSTGRWLLQAAHWDLVDAWQLPEVEERDAYDEDEPLRFASSFASKVLTGSATCVITSVAAVTSTAFTGSVTGAAVGDRVIATPPAALGATAAETGRLSYHAWVSAANTVTIMLTNASASSANTNAAIRTEWPITVIKS